MKKAFTLLMCAAAAATMFAQAPQQGAASVFESRIVPPQVKSPEQMKEESRMSPSQIAINRLQAEQQKAAQQQAAQKGRRWVNWLKSPMMAETATGKTERLDSIISVTLGGKLQGKQVLAYTDDGRPTRCTNYIADSLGNWVLDGHFLYEYDKQGRLISTESVSDSDPSSSGRYEYIYNDQTSYYTQQFYYVMTDGEWVPSQQAEYKFDANHNTIDEIHRRWNNETSAWDNVERKTAVYDAKSRMTSYCDYAWDGTAQAWTGVGKDARAFAFDDQDRQYMLTISTWENNEWRPYWRITEFYDANGLDTLSTHEYWNRAKQDWSGMDKWGYSTQYNLREVRTYDAKKRMLDDKIYTQKASGEYAYTNGKVTNYVDQDNGDYTATTEILARVSGSVPTPYKQEIVKYNKFGAETYYKLSRYPSAGSKISGPMPQTESISDIDANNFYFGNRSYYFYLDADSVSHRFGVSAEEVLFADDWYGPTDGFTPYMIKHYRGVGRSSDTTWVDKDEYTYTWERNLKGEPVLTSCICYIFQNNKKLRQSGFSNTYDLNTDMNDVLMWPIPKKSNTIYQNKTLTVTNLYNLSTWNGTDAWDQDYSNTFTYYYNKINGDTGASDLKVTNPDAVEVARYNVMGQRIDGPQPGINIVKYSDGTAAKVLVK